MRFIQRKKKHPGRTGKSRINKRNFIERLVTSYLFKILGVIILMIGVFYALNSLEIINDASEIFSKLFKSTNETTGITNGNYIFDPFLLLYFLPGILILILTGLFAKKFSLFTYVLSLIVIVWFLLVQTIIFTTAVFHQNGSYANINIALIFIFLSVTVMLFNATLQKKQFIIILTTIFFYFSLEFALIVYNYRTFHIFPFIIIYTVVLGWLNIMIKKPFANLLNQVLCFSIWSLFVLRKFIVRSQPDFLADFFIYGTIFFILFYFVVLYSSRDKTNAMPKWMQMAMGFTNLLFYAGTTSYEIVP